MRRVGERRKTERRRRYWPAALLATVALAVAAGGLLLGLNEAGLLSGGGPQAPQTTAAVETTAVSTTVTTEVAYTHPIEDPKRIVIPAIDVDAEIIRVGLKANGSDMAVPPFGLAGWYELGPVPGAVGAAVIVAHVDSKRGPDVFYHLGRLVPGDIITVIDSDGDWAVFAVDSLEKVEKTLLPTERIWPHTLYPVIRLITCTGVFNRSTGHYLSNLIVYGHLLR